MIHGRTFASRFAGRFLEVLQPPRFVFYGTPGRDVIEAAAPFNPIVKKLAGGVTRQARRAELAARSGGVRAAHRPA